MRLFILFVLTTTSVLAQSAPPPETPVQLPKVEVAAGQQQTQMNAIDRKVYNVGHDLQAVAGSAADVLQNVPSVQVDIDGNVSLRGDSGVQILIDGHSSALMGAATQGDALSQLPADSIERIEVITTPSSKYKPDGTAGIINIVLKKKHPKGAAGTLRLTVGNDERYGAALNGSYNPGKYLFSGMVTFRKDDRVRIATDSRHYIDPTTGVPSSTKTITTEVARPDVQLGQFQFQDQANDSDKLSEAVDYYFRTLHKRGDETDSSLISGVGSLFDRLRDDPEAERDISSVSTYDHDFGRSDNTLSAEIKWEHYTEIENNHYTDILTVPPGPSTYDTTKIYTNEPSSEFQVSYSNVLFAERKIEFGVDQSDNLSRQNHQGAYLDPVSGLWVSDPTVTNNFNLDQSISAVFGTYRQNFGKFSAMGGLRFESANVKTDQITIGLKASQRYLKVYPSLHLTYDIDDVQQLQLNYSHRVHRPDFDDLNPFPLYQDPFNLREGNPYLRPEEVHSIEAGYQYKQDDSTYLATAFYKYSYNGFTTVSQYITSTTLQTIEENIGKSQSGGLEFGATTKVGTKLTLNANADVFYNEIDASNLGYATTLSTYAWAGKFNVEYALTDATSFQINGNYSAKRLTPQGERLPNYITNIGLKHELKNRHVTLVLTVSDLFNTLKDETRLTTPLLTDDYVRRRNSRTLYAGVIYSFGGAKKKKDDALQFDNAP